MESIPAGADRCAGIGTLADPEVTGLTNDGPIVAFAGFDAAHAGDLWLGDLRSGAVEMVCQAATGIEIASPQLASGHLLWIEWAREARVDYSVGGAGGPGVTEWWLKDMDTQSRRIATLAHDHTTGFGGATFADKIVFDGSRLGIEEQIQDAATRIVVQDWPSGKSVQSVTVADRVYDFALTGDGVLYSAGSDRYGPYGTDHMHLMDCPREGSCQTVAPDVYDVAASGDVVHVAGRSQLQPGLRLVAGGTPLHDERQARPRPGCQLHGGQPPKPGHSRDCVRVWDGRLVGAGCRRGPEHTDRLDARFRGAVSPRDVWR
jgi:hypothetical protein